MANHSLQAQCEPDEFDAITVIRNLENKVHELTAQLAEAKALACRDGLTGLYNRREFDSALATEWNRAKRDQSPLALLFIDLDNLKNLNKSLGHLTANGLLTLVAECISEAAKRATDLAFRFGGDEFCLLLPNTELSAAYVIAEAIRESVEKTDACSVTIGLGCITPNGGQASSELVDLADRAMYLGKSQGRNCVRAITAQQHGRMVDRFGAMQAGRGRTTTIGGVSID